MPRLPDYPAPGPRSVPPAQPVAQPPDRAALASARTRLLAADVRLRRDLADDPDHSGWSARYEAGMEAARAEAGGLLRSDADRARFEQVAALDQQRGATEVARAARQLQFGSSLASLNEIALGAPDEGTRVAAIDTAGELFAAALAEGDLTPENAGQRRRNWVRGLLANRDELERLTTSGGSAPPDVTKGAAANRSISGQTLFDVPSQSHIIVDRKNDTMSQKLVNIHHALADIRVRAFLDTIAYAEGRGYGRVLQYNSLFGNGTFSNFSRHPGKAGSNFQGRPQSAAGRYQIQEDYYKEAGKELAVTDFSPGTQDMLAVYKMMYDEPDIYNKLVTGDLRGAIFAASRPWASFPQADGTSRYRKQTAVPVEVLEATWAGFRDAYLKEKVLPEQSQKPKPPQRNNIPAVQ